MKSIHRWLLVWLIVGCTGATMMAAFLTFHTAREEAGELFDYELRTVALSLPHQVDVGTSAQQPTQGFKGIQDDRLGIQIWDRALQLTYHSSNEPIYGVPARLGFSTIDIEGRQWRIFALQEPDRLVTVAQPYTIRDALGFRLARRILWPVGLLVPIIIGLVLLTVACGLRPIEHLSRHLLHRSVTALSPLPTAGLPDELRPLAEALNQLLQRLEMASEAQRTFVADAAHELRTPLTALKLQMQAATQSGLLAGDAETIDGLGKRIDRTIYLVQQLLVMAREDANRARETGAVSLRHLAEQSIVDFSVVADAREIDLGLECPSVAAADLCIVSGDAQDLRVMLNNIVDNALRYTPRGGRIDVVLSRHDAGLTLQVIDAGPGIPAAEIDRVLDRFYRGEGARGQGSGLGLAIAASIAQRHDARLSLANRRLGAASSGLIVTFTGFAVVNDAVGFSPPLMH